MILRGVGQRGMGNGCEVRTILFIVKLETVAYAQCIHHFTTTRDNNAVTKITRSASVSSSRSYARLALLRSSK